MTPIHHKYSKESALELMRQDKFKSFAEMVDVINQNRYVSYQSFINYLNNKPTGIVKIEAIEQFFDDQLKP